MKLKWDQGLASKGKLKGKKTFDHGVPDERKRAPSSSAHTQVQWINASIEDSAPRSAAKRKKPLGENVEEVVCKRVKKVSENGGGASSMTLALIAPQIPALPMTPSAPVPAVLFQGNNAHLFNHYLNHVAKVTVVSNNGRNPFKTIICPMSFESPLIMSNVLSIAAANLSNRMPEYGVIAFHHLNNALTELKQRLTDPRLALTEVTLAGVLGQVSCQLHIGDVANWRVHLTAARGIVNALGGPRAVLAARPDFRFYIQHLAWLDTLAATTSSTKQIGESGYWKALLQSIQGQPSAYSMQDLMGCPENLLEIIAEMTQRFDDIPQATFGTAEEVAQRQILRDELGEEYSGQLDALRAPSAPEDSSSALYEAFRITAKIYLTYRIIHTTCWTASLQALLRDALDLLKLIPARSQEEMALPWPLFIMGSICIYAREQRIVRARYESMISYMGFGNIHRCLELLEDVWQGWSDAERESCPSRIAGQPWDEKELGRKRWEDVMKEKGYDLLLA